MNRILIFICLFFLGLSANAAPHLEKQITQVLKKQILQEATWALKEQPVTLTASSSPRSAGGKNDFYSEGDYWWPDPQNPDGPYIQKDGLTNPDNFVAHRFAVIRLGKIIGSLASAYKLTGDKKYINHAVKHLKAWFINADTKMNPHLLYAQAIKGRFTGRGIGIIDTIHLMDVAQGVIVMEKGILPEDLKAIKNWFTQYLNWLMTHPYGKAEMEAKNNHGTCFTMQVASFAKLTGDEKLLEFCRNRYKTVLLPNQMALDGSFPLEMARTKPYGYSLFNLDAMATLCQILSTPQDNLWAYKTEDGKSIQKGITFLYPYLTDKSKWPLKPDVMYWNEWPVAQPALVFGANAFKQTQWFKTWAALNHQPQVEEVIRNLVIKYPIIWL
ncbi:alginate lyase family protein [Pedobacter glucosidilyticus]|uniref:alginate lyase family protein n=1 Tax=Pedobacter glucosidilyticus TaxID=1122941 RepID=UPI00040487FB|nr:alginate lyase family protein [Pedobacter glucosidilyticus]